MLSMLLACQTCMNYVCMYITMLWMWCVSLQLVGRFMSQWCMCEAYQEALLQSNPLKVLEVMQLVMWRSCGKETASYKTQA
jgi:hypothetical protein